MAWTSPYTFATGEAVPAAELNAMLRDNMNEQAPAKATTRGSYFVSTGPNTIAERGFKEAFTGAGFNLSTMETWTSVADGPELEVTHGGQLLVLFAARIYMFAVGGEASVAPAVVGKAGASINHAIRHSGDNTDLLRSYSFRLFTGLGAGTDTVRLEYHTEIQQARFHQRQLLVMPL